MSFKAIIAPHNASHCSTGVEGPTDQEQSGAGLSHEKGKGVVYCPLTNGIGKKEEKTTKDTPPLREDSMQIAYAPVVVYSAFPGRISLIYFPPSFCT